MKPGVSNISREVITAVVLAGGRASRMGGIDKGLVPLRGRPMIAHVLAALHPQAARVLINANRNRDRYAALGYEVVPDELDGFLGPLAGVAAGLKAATTPFVVTAPCDSPLIGPDLVARLAAALAREQADLAVAHDGEREHPVFLLLRRERLADLEAFLDAGGRKIDLWFARHRVARADFSDRPQAFVNINNAEEHARLEHRLAHGVA